MPKKTASKQLRKVKENTDDIRNELLISLMQQADDMNNNIEDIDSRIHDLKRLKIAQLQRLKDLQKRIKGMQK